jgi:hypothetical protein
VHIVGFITKKFATMHGHMNVIYEEVRNFRRAGVQRVTATPVSATNKLITNAVPVIWRFVMWNEWSLLSPSSPVIFPVGVTRLLRNVGTRIPYYVLSHPGWQSTSGFLP